MDDLFYHKLISDYVEDRHYIRRFWLNEQVESALADPRCRFMLLTGEPGSGKTAFMAGLAEEHPNWLRYFIRRDIQSPMSSGDTRSLLFTLGYQLAVTRPQIFQPANLQVVVRQRVRDLKATGRVTGITIEDLNISPFYNLALQVEQDVTIVAGELEGISIKRMVAEKRFLELGNLQYLALLDPAEALLKANKKALIVVLVDALDELRYYQDPTNLLDWFTNLQELPNNLRFVLTSRPDDLLDAFKRRQQAWLKEVKIDPGSDKVIVDLRAYAGAMLKEESLQTALESEMVEPGAFTDGAISKADGNFQYLAALFRAIQGAQEAGDQARLAGLLHLQALPAGLEALYALFLSLIKAGVAQQVFEVELPGAGPFKSTGLMPAWEGLYLPILGVLAVARERLSARQIKDFAGLHTTDYWLQAALRLLWQFMDLGEDGFRLYHSTFPEFITSPGTQDAYPEYYLDPSTWHQRIAAWYRGAAPSWSEMDWRSVDDYGLLHLSEHLYALQESELFRRELYQLICKPYLVAKQARFGTPQSFTADLVLAIDTAQSHGLAELSQELRIRLIYAGITSRSTDVPVEALAALAWLGQAEQAQEYVALIGDVGQQFLAYLAVGQALLDQDLLGQARKLAQQAVKLAGSLKYPGGLYERFTGLAGLLSPLGEAEQVVTLARQLPDPDEQAEAMIAIAAELARAGQDKRSVELASEALKMSLLISSKRIQGTLLAKTSHALFLAGQHEKAESAIQQALTVATELKGEYRSWLVSDIVPVLDELGKQALAVQEIEATWALVRLINSPWIRTQSLMGLSYDLGRLDELDLAAIAAMESLEAALEVKSKPDFESALSRAAVALAWTGLDDRAMEAAGKLEDIQQYSAAFFGILEARAERGDIDLARSQLLQIEDEGVLALGLKYISMALARNRRVDNALSVACEITLEERRFETLVSILRILVDAGPADAACQAAKRVADLALVTEQAHLSQILGGEDWQTSMATLALLLAQSGDERAIGLLEIVLGRSRVGLPQMLSDKEGGGEIDRTPDQVGQTAWEEADAICHSAEALIRSGQMTEASRVATQALEAAGNIKERYGRLVTKIRASQILASSGQKESALTELNKVEANLGKLKTPWEKVHTILSLAQAFDQIGEREQVLRLLAGLEPEVERYSGVASRVSVLCEMIELFASAGNLEHALELADHAETLAARISSGSIAAWEKIMAFGSIADALFKIHQPDPADRAVEQAVQVIEKIRLKGQAAKVQARLAQILARAGQNGRAADLARQAFDRALLLDPGRERDKWEAMLESVEALLLAAEHQEAFNMARQMANAIVTSGAGVYSQEWFTHSALYCLNMIVQALHQSGLNGQALEIWRMQFSDPARANRKDVLFAIEYGRPLLAEIAGEEMLREIEQAVGEAQSW